jgi:hypothetical protein
MAAVRVERWIQELRQRHEGAENRCVEIDEIGEVIGADLATTEDIDALFTGLEALGFTVGVGPAPAPPAQLRAVLLAARALKAKGERPTFESVARAAGVSITEVRSALLYAQVLQR